MATGETTSAASTIATILPIVVGGLLTFFGGWVGGYVSDSRKNKREERNLARAFRGEIAAIRNIAVRRKYAEGLADVIQEIETSQRAWQFSVHVRQKYFNVYEKNVDKIGSLASPIPELIATLYTHANSVLEDFQLIRENGVGNSLNEQLDFYRELLEVLRETIRLADKVMEEIDREYP